MQNSIKVEFPGNLRVQATTGDFTIETDQPASSGGDNSAPTPFGLFAASIATCAGYFALKFCRTRELETEGLHLEMFYEWDDQQKKYPEMTIVLTLPDNFPEKYRSAIQKSVDQCVVKKHILEPPEFIIELS